MFKYGPSLLGAFVVPAVNAFAVRITRDSSLEAFAVLLQAFALLAVAAFRMPLLVLVTVIFGDVIVC